MIARSLAYFATPHGSTLSGSFASDLAALPDDIGGICAAVQGLLMHEAWAEAYGSSVDARRDGQKHVRGIDWMLDWLSGGEGLMPGRARAADDRFVCVCRHFAVLAAAILRAKGRAARARCGFAGYFDRNYFCDHWVVEYWEAEAERWKLADAQLDSTQREMLKIGFDPVDVPRDQFVIAGSAWARSRADEVNPSLFGFFDERGYWFIAANMMRDAAALNKTEFLPWDDWAPMIETGADPTAEQFAFFDRLAALTLSPDERLDELHALHGDGAPLALPSQVFNAIRQRLETV